MATWTPKRPFKSTRNERPLQTPSTLPRYTPYTKSAQRSRILARTPLPDRRHLKSTEKSKVELRHQVQRSRNPTRENKTNEPKDALSSIVAGKSWRIYRASPFYRLNLNKKYLKNYERSLNAWLVKELLNEHEPKRTSFKVIEDCSSDEFALEVKVVSTDKKDSVELIALLCCGRNNDENLRDYSLFNSSVAEGDHKLTLLPICLIKSNVLLKESFFEWLEGQFGCKLTPHWFSPIDLAWLVSLCTGIGEPLQPTELTYQVPTLVPGLSTITLNMVAKDARELWDAIHESSSSREFFTNDESSRFLKSLESHFYHHFKINLDQMQLVTVGTSLAYFGKEGRLKILQKKYACYILQQIVTIAHLGNF